MKTLLITLGFLCLTGISLSQTWQQEFYIPYGTDAIKISPNDSFGIGISNPTSLFHIRNQVLGGEVALTIENKQSWDKNASVAIDFKHCHGNAGKIVSIRKDKYIYNDSSTFNSAIAFFTSTGGVNEQRMIIDDKGNVGIGTDLSSNPNNYTLAVNGTIAAKEVKVEITSSTWSDYVFSDNYKLKSLKEVENFINEKNHLPDIPTAKEVEDNGVNLGEMDAKLLQKIEELTLYIIEQNKKIEDLQSQINELKD